MFQVVWAIQGPQAPVALRGPLDLWETLVLLVSQVPKEVPVVKVNRDRVLRAPKETGAPWDMLGPEVQMAVRALRGPRGLALKVTKETKAPQD